MSQRSCNTQPKRDSTKSKKREEVALPVPLLSSSLLSLLEAPVLSLLLRPPSLNAFSQYRLHTFHHSQSTLQPATQHLLPGSLLSLL